MIWQISLLIILFPIAFILGKLITKNSEEEINEIRPTATKIMKILIIITAFITLNATLNTITAIIITGMILIHLIFHDKTIQEKVLLALIASVAIFYAIEDAIILGLIAMFFKGLTFQNAGDKILTKENATHISLMIVTMSLKFIIIMIVNKLTL